MKKGKFLIIFLVILVVLGAFSSRYFAQKSIDEYMAKQGIANDDIVVDSFFKDWRDGGYTYNVSIKDEDPNIYYHYHYDYRSIIFNALKTTEDAIKEKDWGGTTLNAEELNSLKYTPLT